MKTEEDEAFDDLAKRQGAWGGGFKAKQAMAADKLQEPWNEDEWRRNNWRCGHGWLRGEQCESCNAPQPPSEWAGIKAILDEYGLQAIDFVADFKAVLAQPAQEPDYKVALDEWLDKTEWVQEKINSGHLGARYLGMHRADVLRYLAYPNTVTGKAPAQPAQEPYDQTALELCNVCGWKTLIPDDCCLNCERAQPAQEPVAFLDWYENAIWGNEDFQDGCHRAWDAALEHTTPPPREWVGLTDDEVNNLAAGCHLGKSVQGAIYEAAAKLKEKNA